MKDNWFKLGILAVLTIMFFSVIACLVEHSEAEKNPLKPEKGFQRTLEYTGFDGKKHQAIVINTATNNWVVVEKR